MSQYMGFDADVASLNKTANQDLPGVVTSINTEASMIYNLEMTTSRGAGGQAADNSGSVFSNGTVHSDLGSKYNGIVQQLYDGLTALSGSINTAAQRLKTIADNYERIDQSLAGQ